MIEVVAPGMLTTIQDLGREGRRSGGVGPGGAMDPLSHRVANLLVGNPDDDATIEITVLSPRLAFPTAAWVAIAGATSTGVVVTTDGRATTVPAGHPIWVPDGATLTVGPCLPRGCRSTLAVSGGIDVPTILGGRGTDLRSGFGGWQGRALSTGDRIPVGKPRLPPPTDRRAVVVVPKALPPALSTVPTGTARDGGDPPPIRVLPGPEFEAFPAASRAAFFSRAFVVTPDSDRSGCRLSGQPLRPPTMALSEVVVAGTIQVPPAGHPIVLTADHPVTGGYPRIAVVATIDLPRVGQVAPGTRLRFVAIGPDESRRLIRDRERAIARFRSGLEWLR